jgi:hypothetical protein
LLRGKSVAAAKGKKDLANAEAENAAAAMPTLPVPYGTNPNTLLIQLRLKSILAKKKLGVESRALKASHDKADLDLIDAKI